VELPKAAEMEDVLLSQINKPGISKPDTSGRKKWSGRPQPDGNRRSGIRQAIVSNGRIDDRDIDLVTDEKADYPRSGAQFYAVTKLG
jgi:hypothetical protein